MDDKKKQFSLIYDQYIDKIYRFVYLKVDSVETAEDITSKVFLKGWEAFRNQKEGIKNQNAFLYHIAQNSIIDYYRQRGRSRIVSADYQTQIVDNRNDIHGKAEINSEIRAIKSSMKNLKQDYQNVLILHYLDDMSIVDVASVLKKSEGTVRVMLHRGLKALRKELIKEV